MAETYTHTHARTHAHNTDPSIHRSLSYGDHLRFTRKMAENKSFALLAKRVAIFFCVFIKRATIAPFYQGRGNIYNGQVGQLPYQLCD